MLMIPHSALDWKLNFDLWQQLEMVSQFGANVNKHVDCGRRWSRRRILKMKKLSLFQWLVQIILALSLPKSTDLPLKKNHLQHAAVLFSFLDYTWLPTLSLRVQQQSWSCFGTFLVQVGFATSKTKSDIYNKFGIGVAWQGTERLKT